MYRNHDRCPIELDVMVVEEDIVVDGDNLISLARVMVREPIQSPLLGGGRDPKFFCEILLCFAKRLLAVNADWKDLTTVE